MRVKKLMIIAISLIVVQSCIEEHKPYVSITTENDTVRVNERYLAKIFLENAPDSSIIPLFYVISNKNDTALLPYDEDKECAIFSASGSRIGRIEWHGFVKYMKNNSYEKVEFEKAFYIEN